MKTQDVRVTNREKTEKGAANCPVWRVLDGGHYVPEDKIRSRYSKALELLPKLIDICDKILIYDNSIMPVLVFRSDRYGSEYFPNTIWPIEELKKLLKH